MSTALCIEESGDERSFRTFVPIVAYGRTAGVLRELAEGTPVLIKGKLGYRSWTKDGVKTGRLEVTCWQVQTMPGAQVRPDAVVSMN